MKKWLGAITGINVLIVVVLINLVLSQLYVPTFDLTAGKVHSLSPSSKKIIKNINNTLNIKVYLSTELPAEVLPVKKALKEILDTVARENRKDIKIKYFDPSKDASSESEASKYGIKPIQFSTTDNDKLEIQKGYFGMVMQYNNKQEIIPIVGDVANLEYSIISTIKRLSASQLPQYLVYENAESPEGDIQLFRKFLESSGTVITANLDDDNFSLPDGAKTLVIIGQKTKFSTVTIEKIKKWVESGRGLVIFEDRVTVNSNLQARKIEGSGLDGILAGYGITIEPKLIADTEGAMANFRTQNGSYYTKYLYWPNIRPENLKKDLPPLSGISTLTLPWVSPLTVTGDSEPIIKTTVKASIDDNISSLSPTTQKLGDTTGQFVVGAINSKNAKLVVIGDSDFVKDQFVMNNQENLMLALNLVDYSASDDELMSIRSKSLKANPINQIDDNQKNIIKIAGFVSPIILLLVIFWVNYAINKKRIKNWIDKNI